MKKVYVVQNSNGILMGIFKNKAKAKRLKAIGKERWNERWTSTPIELNHVEKWVLVGGDAYNAGKRSRR